jgi:hypothetical protein
MSRPQDEPMIAALSSQYDQLALLMTRLESARVELIPGPAGFWKGTARHAYDAAIDGLASTVDAGIAALQSAAGHTDRARRELISRV